MARATRHNATGDEAKPAVQPPEELDLDAVQEAPPQRLAAKPPVDVPESRREDTVLLDELGTLLRQIRDRLPSPAAEQARPGLFRRIHRRVKEIEPWGILLAAVGLFMALITFWIDYSDRVEERTVRAWQLHTTRAPGNSGKREALEYLNRWVALFQSLSAAHRVVVGQ